MSSVSTLQFADTTQAQLLAQVDGPGILSSQRKRMLIMKAPGSAPLMACLPQTCQHMEGSATLVCGPPHLLDKDFIKARITVNRQPAV